MTQTPDNREAIARIEQCHRDAAADAVKAYRDDKNGNWQARIRAGQCDDGVMVQAFAKHRADAILATRPHDGWRDGFEACRKAAIDRINAGKTVADPYSRGSTIVAALDENEIITTIRNLVATTKPEAGA